MITGREQGTHHHHHHYRGKAVAADLGTSTHPAGDLVAAQAVALRIHLRCSLLLKEALEQEGMVAAVGRPCYLSSSRSCKEVVHHTV